jgi:hypothetical protein
VNDSVKLEAANTNTSSSDPELVHPLAAKEATTSNGSSLPIVTDR